MGEHAAKYREAVDRLNGTVRACTCHPDERPSPCARKFALRDCWRAAVLADTQQLIVALKNRDRQPLEDALLAYAMRVRTALE